MEGPTGGESKEGEGDSAVRSFSLNVMDLLEQMETSDLQEGEEEGRMETSDLQELEGKKVEEGKKEEKEEEEEEEEDVMNLQEEEEEGEGRLLQMPAVIMVEGGVDPPTDGALEPETDTRTRNESDPASPAPAGDNLPLQSDLEAGDNLPLQSDLEAGDNLPLQSDLEPGDNLPLQSDLEPGDNLPLQSDLEPGDNLPDLEAGDNLPDLEPGDNLPDLEAGGSGTHSKLPDSKEHHGLYRESPSPSLMVTESQGYNDYSLAGNDLLKEEDYQAMIAAAEWVGEKMDSPSPGVKATREEDYQAMIAAAKWVGGKMEPHRPPGREEESDGFLMSEYKDDKNLPVVVLESYSSGSDQSPSVHRDDWKGRVLGMTTNPDTLAPPDPVVDLQPGTSSQGVCKKSLTAPVIDEVMDVLPVGSQRPQQSQTVGSQRPQRSQTVGSQRPQGSQQTQQQPERSQQGAAQDWYPCFVCLPYMV